MKYQVRRYKIDNQQGDVFKDKAQEEAVRIHQEDVGEAYTIFITDKVVSGFDGDIGIIESDSNGDKIEVIREPFVQHPITLKELLDITPDLLADYERFTLLTDIQKALFKKRYSELDSRFVKGKKDLEEYKLDLLNKLYPLVRQDGILVAYFKLRKELEDKSAENAEAIANLNEFKKLLEAEYSNALGYMRTDDERKKLTEQHQKSLDFVSDRLKQILGNENSLLDNEVSDDIVTQIREVAETHKEAYQLLEDLSEARQLLSYVREEPYQMLELTMTEIAEVYANLSENQTKTEKQPEEREQPIIDITDDKAIEDEINKNTVLSKLEEVTDTISNDVQEDDEVDFEKEDDTKDIEETVRGSRAIANLMKEINAEYVADSELEKRASETSWKDEEDIIEDKNEAVGNTDIVEDKLVTLVSKGTSKGFSTKKGVIISGVLFAVSLAGSFFVYNHYNKETTELKKEVVKKAQVLEELKEASELDKESYEDLVERFLEKHELTKESKRYGLSGIFSHDGTVYFVRRFVRETGTLETYNKLGEKVDFGLEEIEKIIEDGE